MKNEWGAVLIILIGGAFICAALPFILPIFILFAIYKVIKK